jgi:hypothetical protein
VGTHALTQTSTTTLWNRLSAHRGATSELGWAGNHRGSVFRLHVGSALLRRNDYPPEIAETWGRNRSADRKVREGEHPLEVEVSHYIGAMPFLWLEVPGEGGEGNLRAFVEAHAIALLSNFDRPPIDPPSSEWLGHFAAHPAVRGSGLWNVRHVHETHDPRFLDAFEDLVQKIAG